MHRFWSNERCFCSLPCQGIRLFIFSLAEQSVLELELNVTTPMLSSVEIHTFHAWDISKIECFLTYENLNLNLILNLIRIGDVLFPLPCRGSRVAVGLVFIAFVIPSAYVRFFENVSRWIGIFYFRFSFENLQIKWKPTSAVVTSFLICKNAHLCKRNVQKSFFLVFNQKYINLS